MFPAGKKESGPCHLLHKPHPFQCDQDLRLQHDKSKTKWPHSLQHCFSFLPVGCDGQSLLQDVHCFGKVPICLSVCALCTVNEASLWFWTVICRVSVLCCRYFFIACPLLDFIRKTKTSVLVCLLVWTLCVFSCPLGVLLEQSERIFIFALFPAPLFICCLAGTLRSLPDATSVPSEEKQRIIGTLVLLLVSYCLIIIPTIILIVLEPYLFDSYFISIFSLLNSFEVLILFVIMCRVQLKICWHVCAAAADPARDHQCEWWQHTRVGSCQQGKEKRIRGEHSRREAEKASKQSISLEPSFTKMCVERKICA